MVRLRSIVRRALFGALVLGLPARLHAQGDGIFERLNLDNLQITALGAAYGRVMPSQVKPTHLLAIQADYGNISPTWRVVFGASYWSSELNDGVVQAFADSLQKSLSDPTAKVLASPVRLYDVTFNTDLRYTPNYSGELKPFVAFGAAAHVINAEGKLIKGTFVERSLDDIAAGLYVATGLSVRLMSHFGVEGTVRADLLSGFRSMQGRVGGMYYFGHIRGPRADSSAAGAREENGKR